MNYRPKEGWDAKQIVRQTLIHHWMAQNKEDTLTMTAIPPFYCALVEAGADAILEVLKVGGHYVETGEHEMTLRWRGTFFFIPGEEEG